MCIFVFFPVQFSCPEVDNLYLFSIIPEQQRILLHGGSCQLVSCKRNTDEYLSAISQQIVPAMSTL